jgi:hypothetical protein
MHSFSCFFLLHHHFEAVTTLSDSISISSGSLNDVTMSDESDVDGESFNNDIQPPIPTNEIIEPEPYDLPEGSTINPGDDESQFIYDEDCNRLICIGTNFDDIPQGVIDSFSQKTKVKKFFFFFE